MTTTAANGKTALVTGASGNLGHAIVQKFIDEGYRVIGTVLPNDFVLLNFPDNVFEKIVVNLMNETDTEKMILNVVDKYKTIDAAVLTVGGFATGNVVDTKNADVMEQIQLNFETAYNVARPVFKQMLKQNSGRIFLTGARPGFDSKSGKGMVAYSLAKSLIFRLADLMNDESASTNVVTSVVVPSTIDTAQNREAMPDADFSTWVTPESIAEAIYFYCTETAAILREPVIKVYNKA